MYQLLIRDVWFIIFSYSNLREICHLTQTSKFFKSLLENKNFDIRQSFILTNPKPKNIYVSQPKLIIPPADKISDFWLDKFKKINAIDVPSKTFMYDNIFLYFMIKLIDKDLDKLEYLLKFYQTGDISFDRFQTIYPTSNLEIFKNNYNSDDIYRIKKKIELDKKKQILENNYVTYKNQLTKINECVKNVNNNLLEEINTYIYRIKKKNLINYGARHYVTSFLVLIIIFGSEEILPKILEWYENKKINLHTFCFTEYGHYITDSPFHKTFYYSCNPEINLIKLIDYSKILEKYGFNSIMNTYQPDVLKD